MVSSSISGKLVLAGRQAGSMLGKSSILMKLLGACGANHNRLAANQNASVLGRLQVPIY